MITRINLWSGPRNVSTALMYSFAQRKDTLVVDEPLYAHYLRVSGMDHPGREEILQSQANDGLDVVSDVILGDLDRPVLFLKQMAHHLVEMDWAFMLKTHNVLLIRDPKEVIVSFIKIIPEPGLKDIGIKKQFEIFEYLSEKGKAPIVIDGQELLKSPSRVLGIFCKKLGIPFDEHMLQWKAGARPEDGVWAKYWYSNVHRSTAFQAYRKRTEPVPEAFVHLHQKAKPFYDRLFEHAIKAN